MAMADIPASTLKDFNATSKYVSYCLMVRECAILFAAKMLPHFFNYDTEISEDSGAILPPENRSVAST